MNKLIMKALPSIFTYKDGHLYFKDGSVCEGVKSKGYLEIHVISERIGFHRIIWYLHHGFLPELPLTIDHIDRNKLNNRIENLRVATPKLQAINNDRTLQSGSYKAKRYKQLHPGWNYPKTIVVSKKVEKKSVHWSQEELAELDPILREYVLKN